MKRSEINKHIKWAMDVCRETHFNLPDFAFWSPADWDVRRKETEHMISVMQGWDVTDYNSGNFEQVGAVLFTIRNGNVYDNRKGTPYCEKIIVMKAGQKLPLHFHYSKTEDIINRGGGTLCVRMFNSLPKEDGYQLDQTSDVQVSMDGISVTVPAGGFVEVANGNSITLHPYIYHEFWAKETDGDLVIGEVSSINDDRIDNHFAKEMNLPPIEEDEPALYPLCNGYVHEKVE